MYTGGKELTQWHSAGSGLTVHLSEFYGRAKVEHLALTQSATPVLGVSIEGSGTAIQRNLWSSSRGSGLYRSGCKV